MPSHPATLLEATPRGEGWNVRARLACGCEVALELPGDRVLEIEGAGKILVGKYPCPNRHPVLKPR